MRIRLVALCAVLLGAPGYARAAFNADLYIACTDACSVLRDLCSSDCVERNCLISKLSICAGDAITICLSTCSSRASACRSNCYVASSDVDAVARLADSGRRLIVTGPLQCDEGLEVRDLHVSVIQTGVGATAEGRGRLTCTGGGQSWSVDAVLHGPGQLRPFDVAEVCAVADFGQPGLEVEVKRWCRQVTVLPAGVELED
jgi:hypothetical protein